MTSLTSRLASLAVPFAVAVAVAAAAAGCGQSLADSTPPPKKNDPPPPITTPPPKREPQHRPSAAACPKDRPPGTADPSLSGGCKKDSECKAGHNGRCTRRGGGHSMPMNSCEYDGCFSDDDCGRVAKATGPVPPGAPGGGGGARSLCICNGGHDTGRHVCMTGNCRVDADCGPGGYCSPSYGSDPSGGCWGYQGWYCHTKKDKCTDDEDCRATRSSDGRTSCTYIPQLGHWGCASIYACPVG